MATDERSAGGGMVSVALLLEGSLVDGASTSSVSTGISTGVVGGGLRCCWPLAAGEGEVAPREQVLVGLLPMHGVEGVQFAPPLWGR